MNMNCFNPHYPDGMDFRRQDPMPDMSSWYMDQDISCGIPQWHSRRHPESIPASRPHTMDACWYVCRRAAAAYGMEWAACLTEWAVCRGDSSDEYGNSSGKHGAAPANMGAAPANMETALWTCKHGAMLRQCPAMPAQGQNNMAFCEDLIASDRHGLCADAEMVSAISPWWRFLQGNDIHRADPPFVMGRCM